MKNKKLIRLTESDLHKIVKESVNNVLTELDWKTYASAEKKARERGDMDYWREKGVTGIGNLVNKAAHQRMRADRFGDAAKDAFNRDYGYQNGNYSDEDYANVKLGGKFGYQEPFAPHAIGNVRHHPVLPPKAYEHGNDRYDYEDKSPEEFFQGNDAAAQAYRNADDEVKNWKKGNYKYDSIKDGGEGKWIKKR